MASFVFIAFICLVPTYQGTGINLNTSSLSSKQSLNAVANPSNGVDIQNDTAFTLYGFPGDGSLATPYLIENLTISTNNKSIAISITNTAMNFIIKNCTITSAFPYAIYISSVTASLIHIQNNTISKTNSTAIWLVNTNNVFIQNNILSNNNAGIFQVYSNNTIISQNILNYCGGSGGFNALYSHGIVILNNTFEYDTFAGINIVHGDNITIKQNLLTHSVNDNGITFRQTNNSYIINNSIGFNHVSGIWLDNGSMKNIVYYNLFYNPVVYQAWDDGQQNIFYNSSIEKGNYYSTFINSPGATNFTIFGFANSIDPYPLYMNFTNVPIKPLIITSIQTSTSTTTQTVTTTVSETATQTTTTSNISTVTSTKTTDVSLLGILLGISALIIFNRKKIRKI